MPKINEDATKGLPLEKIISPLPSGDMGATAKSTLNVDQINYNNEQRLRMLD